MSRCPHSNEFIANDQASIDIGRTAVHHFRYVDSIVAGNMLITDTAGYRKTQSFATFHQIDFQYLRTGWATLSLYAQPDDVAGFFQGVHGRSMRDIDHGHVVDLPNGKGIAKLCFMIFMFWI